MIHLDGETNVKDLRTGADAARGLGKEIGKFCVMSMEIPWKVTREKIGGSPEAVIMIETMEESWLDIMCDKLPDCDSVVGVGGGMAIDAAKYVSWKKGIRLISVPTILSVDAFTTPAAGIRRNHEVAYVGHASPDPLVIDFGIIRSAPPELNIAGIGDLLSMHTASFDWNYANSKGKSEYPFSEKAIGKAVDILEILYGLLPEIKNTTDKGLMAIVEGYIKLNTICLPAGHFRVEEGSEHYLFYELEERLKRPFVHGYIVGLGIYLLSQLQGNRFDFIRQVMKDVALPYDPKIMDIRREDLISSLLNLRSFVECRPKLWYTVINDSNITREWAEAAVEDLKF
ncbi:MAG: iron-containing alcohol dehydrogenase [Bacteroidetes bacterium]|nr:iron-containing alcohol dehydrogenase [Bacteroidota bacterium]MDA1122032.1 iron-containing alcohol dehydrogenase [Bacteroidota bacterium]